MLKCIIIFDKIKHAIQMCEDKNNSILNTRGFFNENILSAQLGVQFMYEIDFKHISMR